MRALGNKSKMRFISHNPSGELVKFISKFLKKLRSKSLVLSLTIILLN